MLGSIESHRGLRRSEMTMDDIHPIFFVIFVFNIINFLLGCWSVAYG